MESRVFSRSQGVVCREVAGETFLVPIHGHMADLSELFVLNEVGSLVWELLAEQRTLEALAVRVAEEFEVGLDQALADAGAFVTSLVDAGLAAECAAEGV